MIMIRVYRNPDQVRSLITEISDKVIVNDPYLYLDLDPTSLSYNLGIGSLREAAKKIMFLVIRPLSRPTAWESVSGRALMLIP